MNATTPQDSEPDPGPIEGIPYHELQPGQNTCLRRRLTLHDLHLEAMESPDTADVPSHLEADLQYRIATHGIWGTALITVAVATRLPGPGSRVLRHELEYHGPVALGDQVTVTLTVREKRPQRQVWLDCEVIRDDGERIIHGQVLVEAPEQRIRAGNEALEYQRRPQLRRLLQQAEGREPLRMAVVHPVDEASLSGALAAAQRGLIEPVLVGPEQRIRALAETHGLELGGIRLIDTEHSHAAAARAAELARDGTVEALMKGALHTDEFMQPIVSRACGLRTDRRMSHAWVMDVPTYPRPLCITDSGLNIRPDLATKADITRNAVELLQAMGVERPRVAILSATEEVNPQIQSTLDAAALCKMADRGQIPGADLDGPLAFDNAISETAAQTKGIRSSVAGRPDILLAPDLESANMLGKQLRYLANAETAGIVLGARIPIVLTSRADDRFSRMASCAIAVLLARHREQDSERDSEDDPA